MIPEALPTLSAGAHRPDSGKACVMEYVSLLAGEAWSDRPGCTHPVLAEVARNANDAIHDSERHLLVPMIGRLFGTNKEVDGLTFRLAIHSARHVQPFIIDLGQRVKVESALRFAEQNPHPRHHLAIRGLLHRLGDFIPPVSMDSAFLPVSFDDGKTTVSASPVTPVRREAHLHAVRAAKRALLTLLDGEENWLGAISHTYQAQAIAGWGQPNVEGYVAWLATMLDEYDRLTGRTSHHEVTEAEYATLCTLKPVGAEA